MLSMGGMWGAKVIRARTGVQTDEAQPTRKMEEFLLLKY